MRFLLRASLLLLVLLSPIAFLGCSSQLSEEETPIVSSDEDESATPATNDPENP